MDEVIPNGRHFIEKNTVRNHGAVTRLMMNSEMEKILIQPWLANHHSWNDYRHAVVTNVEQTIWDFIHSGLDR